jgi:hypothetical protein
MRCRAARRCRKALGRRGTFLLILGTGKTCWGASFLVDPPSGVGLELLTRWGSLQQWAWLWILAGLITTVSAFLRVGRDGWGLPRRCHQRRLFARRLGRRPVPDLPRGGDPVGLDGARVLRTRSPRGPES